MPLNISNFATDQDDLVTQSQVKGLTSPAPYIKIPSGDTLGQAMAGWAAAKANNSVAPAIIGMYGDSIVGGYNLTDGITNGYPNRLKQLLQAQGFAWYGESYSCAPYMLNPQQIANTRYGSWLGGANGHQLDAGLGRVAYDSTTTGSALINIVIPTGAVACDIISLAYQAGTWGYKVDGGSTQTVTSTPTSGGTQQQNASFYKTTISLNNNTALQLGFQNVGLAFMPNYVAFRYGNTGIGMTVQTSPAGSVTDWAAGSGTNTASAVVSTVPGISAPDDRMLPLSHKVTGNNVAGSGWPLNPNLAIIAYYANAIGRGADPNAERRALDRLCRALRAGNDSISFAFLINSIPDQVYAASNFETTGWVAERGSQYKQVIYDVAHSVNAVVIDIDQKWGETAVAQGFLPANQVHPTGTGASTQDGHFDIAQAIFSIL